VLGVLNGRDLSEDKILAWARSADVIYAADGGAALLLANGIKPVVVGDLDSLERSALPEGVRVVYDSGQDSTDCDKLLTLAGQDGVASITLVGVEGDRLDHMLATLASLVGRRKKVRLGLRRGIGIVVPCGELIHLPGQAGQTLSVIPLTLCWGVNLSGVEWTLNDAEMRPGLHISISNEVTENPTIIMGGGTCLVVLEHDPEELPLWQA
jgi:thiamine pyrophosphokinase